MPKKKEIAEEIKEEIVAEQVEAQDEVEAFIDRTLMAINQMTNKAKAKRSAERVLANRKGK